MKKELVIWGATGQCIVLEEFLKEEYNIIALYDKNANIESPFSNVPIYHSEMEFLNLCLSKNKLYFIVAIGGNNGETRRMISEKLESINIIPITAIHPKSNIASNVKIGAGCQIMMNATIGARTVLKNYCIINTSVNIDHECVIEKGVHIGPSAALAGCIYVKENTFIGTNATILPRLQIGKNVTVGAGAVVVKNVNDDCIVVGNPAKIIKTLKTN